MEQTCGRGFNLEEEKKKSYVIYENGMLRFLYAFSERKVILIHCDKQTGTNQWLFLMISLDSYQEQEEGLFRISSHFSQRYSENNSS